MGCTCKSYGGYIAWKVVKWENSGRRWMATMQMDLREIGCKGVRWIKLAQNCVQWWVLVLEVTNIKLVN